VHGARAVRPHLSIPFASVLALLGCADDPSSGTANLVGARPVQVEVKLTLRSEDIDLAHEQLDLDADDAEERDVFFFDTPELTLFDDGVILRARNIHETDDDSTVKIRPLDAAQVDASWFELDGFKCEIDRTPAASVPSCSLSVDQEEDEIEQTVDGERPIDKLFSSEQEDFLAEWDAAPDWEHLAVLGPVDASVWKLKPKKLGRSITVERWALPDETRILEISARAAEPDADELETKLTDYLYGLGLEVDADGETKTRAALSYFAGAE
jgi:hypothetical protein